MSTGSTIYNIYLSYQQQHWRTKFNSTTVEQHCSRVLILTAHQKNLLFFWLSDVSEVGSMLKRWGWMVWWWWPDHLSCLTPRTGSAIQGRGVDTTARPTLSAVGMTLLSPLTLCGLCPAGRISGTRAATCSYQGRQENIVEKAKSLHCYNIGHLFYRDLIPDTVMKGDDLSAFSWRARYKMQIWAKAFQLTFTWL